MGVTKLKKAEAKQLLTDTFALYGVVADKESIDSSAARLVKWINAGRYPAVELVDMIEALELTDTESDNLSDALVVLLEQRFHLLVDEAPTDATKSSDSDDDVKGNLSAYTQYRRDISQFEMLAADYAVELSKVYRSGVEADKVLALKGDELSDVDRKTLQKLSRDGQRARQNMIEGSLRLVIHIAKSYQKQGLPLEDLIQNGNIGLMRAIDLYDPGKASFATYASFWITKFIRMSIIKEVRAISLPQGIYEDLGKLDKAVRAYVAKNGSEPKLDDPEDLDYLKKEANLSAKRIKSIYKTKENTIVHQLDAPIFSSSQGRGNDSELPAFMDHVEDHTCVNPASKYAMQDTGRRLRRCMKLYLTPLEEKVLILRKGMEDGAERYLEDIGDELGYTKENIRVIEMKAMRKLAHIKPVQDLYESEN